VHSNGRVELLRRTGLGLEVVIVGRSKIVGKFGLLTGNMVKPGAAVIAAARQREHYHNQFGQHVKIA